jgi:protein phosphatase
MISDAHRGIGNRIWNAVATCVGRNSPTVEPTQGQPLRLRASAGWCSEKGEHRDENQDRCHADCQRGLFAVADGMGGHNGGSEASEITVRALAETECFEAASSNGDDRQGVVQALRRVFQLARQTMLDLVARQPDYDGMGTTLAVAVVRGRSLYYARVGDCRVGLVRDGRMQVLTRDETFVQSLVDNGVLTEAQAQRHPYRHYVLNFLGTSRPRPEPDVRCLELLPGDTVVLMTDGITSAVTGDALARLVSDAGDPQQGAERLVQSALRNDARDNVSCVLLKFLEVSEDGASSDGRPAAKRAVA